MAQKKQHKLQNKSRDREATTRQTQAPEKLVTSTVKGVNGLIKTRESGKNYLR